MRLFAAVLPGSQMCESLIRLENELYSQGVTGRYQSEEQLHMTMTFIGEYHDPETIMELMEEVPFEPFTVRLTGLSCRSQLWLAEASCTEECLSYVKSFRHLLAEHSIPVSSGKFFPHFTLVRHAKNLPAKEIVVPEISERITAISLMRSDRGKNGMNYTELGRIEVL